MKHTDEQLYANLPACAAEYIRLVVKKMGWKKKVRNEVRDELIAHFEDAMAHIADPAEKERKAKELIDSFGEAKVLAKLSRRAKKRSRPMWVKAWFGLCKAVGIFFVCLIIYSIYLANGKPNIAVNYIQKANELARPVVDESLNAAPLYQKAFDLYVQEPNIAGTKLTSIIISSQSISELTAEQLAALKQWITDNQKALETFKLAMKKPYCWWNRTAKDNVMLAMLLPDLSSTRQMGRLTCWQAQLEADQGNFDGAFDNLLACYRAGTHFKGPRVLVEQLVGNAMQVIAAGTSIVLLQDTAIDANSLRSFQNEWEKLLAADKFAMNMESEQYFVDDVIQRCYTDNGRGSGHLIPGRFVYFMDACTGNNKGPKLSPWIRSIIVGLPIAVVSSDRQQVTEKVHAMYKKFEDAASITPYQRYTAGISLQSDTPKSKFDMLSYTVYYMMMPALDRVAEIMWRSRTHCSSVPVVVAITRYKIEKGNYPDSLNQLVCEHYLKEVPQDPFSDKPLVYRKTETGFTLYSVGVNFKDDGGKVYRDEKGRDLIWSDKGDAVFWPVGK